MSSSTYRGHHKTMVIVAVQFVEVYSSRQVQCGAGVALATLPTAHDCQAAVMEALQNAMLDHERWKRERLALGAIAGRKGAAKRKNHWLVHRNGRDKGPLTTDNGAHGVTRPTTTTDRQL